MSSEFEKWWKQANFKVNSQWDKVNCKAAWDSALASQQQSQGDTCKAEPKHPMWWFVTVPFGDPAQCDTRDVCLLCEYTHHTQVLAAKEAELSQARERIQELEHKLSYALLGPANLHEKITTLEARIAQLEAVVKAANVLVRTWKTVAKILLIKDSKGKFDGEKFDGAMTAMEATEKNYEAAKSATPQVDNSYTHIWTDAYPLSQQTTPVGQYCSVEGCGEWRRSTATKEQGRKSDLH